MGGSSLGITASIPRKLNILPTQWESESNFPLNDDDSAQAVVARPRAGQASRLSRSSGQARRLSYGVSPAGCHNRRPLAFLGVSRVDLCGPGEIDPGPF